MKRINLITLAAKDLEKSKKFYKDLFDWEPFNDNPTEVAFYDMGGWIFSLYPEKKLIEDTGQNLEPGKGFPGFTLAHNVGSIEDVSAFLEKARSQGVKIIKEAQDVFWGGHHGYIQDPDGHYWEIAHNPFTAINDDGTLNL